jgi:hypothetical protein
MDRVGIVRWLENEHDGAVPEVVVKVERAVVDRADRRGERRCGVAVGYRVLSFGPHHEKTASKPVRQLPGFARRIRSSR